MTDTAQTAKIAEYEEALLDDPFLEWRLPIDHRVEQSLDYSGIETTSLDTHLPETNKGYQMVQFFPFFPLLLLWGEDDGIL